MSENKENILITDFVKKCKSLTNDKLKNDYITSIMKRTYCPILTKKTVLNIMLDKSITDDDIPTIDMFTNKLNFYGAIISMYTYIIPEKDENDVPKSYEMYDLLIENNLLSPILERIGKREINELTMINGLVLDTWHLKNASTHAYVDNLIDTFSHKFGVYAGVGMEKLTELLEDEVKMKKIIDIIGKGIKKIK